MYTYTDKFKLSQERDPYLLDWVYAHTYLMPLKITDADFLDKLDKSFHVDYLMQDNDKRVGISMRTINIESDIHREFGYGIHLRMKDLVNGTPKEFFKNTQKFSKDTFKNKTGLDSLLIAQGFFRHYTTTSPELIGAIVLEVNELLKVVKEGLHVPYVMGKKSTHPVMFTFIPFFELLPRLTNCLFQLKDLSTNTYIKSKNTLQLHHTDTVDKSNETQ